MRQLRFQRTFEDMDLIFCHPDVTAVRDFALGYDMGRHMLLHTLLQRGPALPVSDLRPGKAMLARVARSGKRSVMPSCHRLRGKATRRIEQ